MKSFLLSGEAFSVQRVRVPLDIMTLRFHHRIRREVPDYRIPAKEPGDRIVIVRKTND